MPVTANNFGLQGFAFPVTPEAGGGGGDPPAVPSLTVSDNGDGTASATISAGSAGAANVVWTLKSGSATWVNSGSRTGNGTVLLTLAAGIYTAYVVSTLNSQDETSSPTSFGVTAAGSSYPTVTPTGELSLPVKNLRDLLSQSTTFQTMVGVASANLALPFIHYFEVDEEDPAHNRPRAIVGFHGEQDTEQASTTGWSTTGPLFLQIERDVPSQYRSNAQDARMDFFNLMGAIRSEMKAYCREHPEFLNVVNMPFLIWGVGEIQGLNDPDSNNGELFMGGEFEVHYRGQ